MTENAAAPSARRECAGDDLRALEYVRENYPGNICRVSDILPIDGREISDSSTRYGCYILAADTMDEMRHILSHLALE